MKTRGFFTGAAILAVAGILCRLIGVVFRIPLTHIVGNYGMGLYQMVFPLYSLLLIISSAGVPVAISKMVAKENAEGNISKAKKILINSLILLGIIGAIVTAIFMIFAFQIAKLQGNKDVGIIYLAIAPSVFLVCVIAAFRGYFQGLQNMIPTAASQIIEQIIKVAAGVTLALILIKKSIIWAVFGAIFAVTISEVIALAFLIIMFIFTKKKKDKEQVPKPKNILDFPLMGQILKQSFPITLMAAIFPLILMLDSMIVINMLVSGGADSETATKLFGISSGAVHTLINLPAVLGVAIATAIVPTVSSLLKRNKMTELREKMAMAVKITVLISLFFAIAYFIFAEKIIDLLYHSAFKDNAPHLKLAGNLMKIESFLIILMGISSVFTAMMQGAGLAKYPLIALAIGGSAKIIFQLILLKTSMGIYAVSWGNVICFGIAATVNTLFALRHIKIKKGLSANLLKFLSLTILLVISIYLLDKAFPENRWWILLSGGISFILYGFFIFLLKFFDKKDKNVFN